MSGFLSIISGIFQFIGSLVSAAVDFVVDIFTEGPWAAISNLFGNIWNSFLDNILEPIMALFGITDQDIYITQVLACKIYDEDLLEKMLVENAVAYMTNNLSITAYLKLFADVGDAQFSAYYRYGEWYYIDYLPTAQITSVSIDSSLIKEILEELRGEEVYIMKISIVGVSTNTWCKYYLQENYDYNVGSDYVIINGTYYYYYGAEYDEENAIYLCILSELEQIRVRVYEIVTKEVSSEMHTYTSYTYTHTSTVLYLDKSVTTEVGTYTKQYTIQSDTDENIYYLYEETSTLTQKYLTDEQYLISAVYTNTETTITEVTYEVEESYTYVIDTSEITTESWALTSSYDEITLYDESMNEVSTYTENESSVWEEYTNQTEGTTTSGPVIESNGTFYLVNITTETSTRYYRYDTGSLIDTVSEVTTSIGFTRSGSGTTSSTTTLIETYILTNENPSTYTIEVPYFNTSQRMYQVLYSTPSNSRQYYWLYDPSTEEYEDLGDPVSTTQSLDVYPIAALRISGDNIDNYEDTSVSSITQERYESTAELLDKIGLDVDDVIEAYSENSDLSSVISGFFLLAVSPANDAEIVSKVLYTLFEGLYAAMPYSTEISLSSDSAMSMSVKEPPFNATTMWIPLPESESEEVIGSIGYCTHEVRTNSITTTTYKVTIITNNDDGTYTRTTYTEQASEDLYGTSLGSATSDYTTVTVRGNAVAGTTRVRSGSSTTSSSKDLVVRKQTSATTVNTITVFSMATANFIESEYGWFGVSLDADDENMLIPLPVDVVARLTILEKTSLLGEACYLLFYAVQYEHLEWYETAAFGTFLSIFSICITLIAPFVGAIMGGATFTLSTVLTTLIKSVVITLGTSLALEVISSVVGDTTLKLILSVAVLGVAMFASGVFDSLLEEFDFTKAMNLVQLPVKAINLVTNDLMSDLQSDYSKFTEAYEERLEEYEDIMDELNSGLSTESIVDIFVYGRGSSYSGNASIVNSYVYSPSAFYSMTFDYYRDFDTFYDGLYDSTVHDFVTNKLKIGIVGDSASGTDEDESED